MAAPLQLSLLLLLLLAVYSILSAPTSASAAAIGVTYSSPNSSLPTTPPPQQAPPESIAAIVSDLRFGAVRLPPPDPNLIRAFTFTNTSLLLSIPNILLPELAANRTLAVQWLHLNVLPFYPRSKMAMISVGEDAVAVSQLPFLLPAIRNVHLALHDIGIRSMSVSTTFSFINIVTTAFPPSAARFQEPIGEAVIRPLLQFLEDTNSSFLVNLYLDNMYRLHHQIPLGLALFQEGTFNFRDDFATGVRYRSLFDMMADAVITSLAVAGHESIPLVVTETGWPSSAADGTADSDANPAYAEPYLKSSLRKEGVAQAYIYELVEADSKQQLHQGAHNWGILYPNMTQTSYAPPAGVGPALVVLGMLLYYLANYVQEDLPSMLQLIHAVMTVSVMAVALKISEVVVDLGRVQSIGYRGLSIAIAAALFLLLEMPWLRFGAQLIVASIVVVLIVESTRYRAGVAVWILVGVVLMVVVLIDLLLSLFRSLL